MLRGSPKLRVLPHPRRFPFGAIRATAAATSVLANSPCLRTAVEAWGFSPTTQPSRRSPALAAVEPECFGEVPNSASSRILGGFHSEPFGRPPPPPPCLRTHRACEPPWKRGASAPRLSPVVEVRL